MESIRELSDLIMEFGATEFGLLILTSFAIMIGALGTVFIMGRMLYIVKTDIAKNWIAIISLIFLSSTATIMFDIDYTSNLMEYFKQVDKFIFSVIIIYKTMISGLMYVTFGFKFYNRFENWINIRFPDDEVDVKLNKKKHKKIKK